MENCNAGANDNYLSQSQIDMLNKIKYEQDAHLEVSKNKYRPSIQYGLMPGASTKMRGVSE